MQVRGVLSGGRDLIMQSIKTEAEDERNTGPFWSRAGSLGSYM